MGTVIFEVPQTVVLVADRRIQGMMRALPRLGYDLHALCLSIYLQGVEDGYDAAHHERTRNEETDNKLRVEDDTIAPSS